MARFVPGRKAQEWRRRMRRFLRSRQSVAEFCRQEGVSSPSFYLWRKRLAGAASTKPAGDKRSAKPAGSKPSAKRTGRKPSAKSAGGKSLSQRAGVKASPGFRPVRLLPAAGVSVQLPGGMRMVVPVSDPQALRLVIDTLARVDADRVGDSTPCRVGDSAPC
jgi:transposase-like protein